MQDEAMDKVAMVVMAHPDDAEFSCAVLSPPGRVTAGTSTTSSSLTRQAAVRTWPRR